MRILDELQHAQGMLETGFKFKRYEFELKILAKYLYSQNKNLEDLKTKILEFCNKRITEFNQIKFMNMIKRVCSYAEKNTLFQLKQIDITEYEIQQIKDLQDLKLEKIAFVLLVISKANRQSYVHYMNDKINYTNMINEDKKKKLPIPLLQEGYYADGKINSFFESAKIYLKKKERSSTIKQLIDLALISMTKKCKYKINFIYEESNVAFSIINFDNFILEYMRYIGDNIGNCEICSGLFEIRSSRHRMCKKCWKEKQKEWDRTYQQKKYNSRAMKTSL